MKPGPTEPDKGWRRVTTRDAFVPAVAGKTLSDDGLTFAVHLDRRIITGKARPHRSTGRRDWQDGLFCRHTRPDDEDLGVDCDVIVLRDTRSGIIPGTGAMGPRRS